MIRDAINKIEELVKPEVKAIGGKNYLISKHGFEEVEPQRYYPNTIEVYSLNGLCRLIMEEGLRKFAPHKIFVDVRDNSTVEVYTDYVDDRFRRCYLYRAKCSVPGFHEGMRDLEQAIIELRSLFVPSPDIAYMLDVLSRVKVGESSETNDNGISQEVTVKQGIDLKAKETLRPIVKLAPYRTFLEVARQPDSEFLFRMSKEGEVGLFEADGGVWRLEAKQLIADYLREQLKEPIEAGKVFILE